MPLLSKWGFKSKQFHSTRIWGRFHFHFHFHNNRAPGNRVESVEFNFEMRL